jgi:hypothetical protein
MPRRTDISSILILATLALAGCATDRFERLQAEFAEVSANCRLSGVALMRDASDRRLLHLVFRHRNNMELQARQDGRLACAEHWARERGYRVTTSPHGTVDR